MQYLTLNKLNFIKIFSFSLLLLTAPLTYAKPSANVPTGHSTASSATTLSNKQQSLAPMLEKTTPAVVKITVETNEAKPTFSDKDLDNEQAKSKKSRKRISLGSGVIINAEQGLIVTNAHVVSDGRIIIVSLKNGRQYRAKLIGEDDAVDIAILKINAKHLTSIDFGDSNQLEVGDFVIAIGSPFGLMQTVTSGIVSALNRSEPQIEGYQSFIQTDTPINPGNSGGALVNRQGQLIGINTAIVSPSFGSIGIGFAIPSNMVKSVVKQLVQYGKVERGMLGVIAQDITPPLADALKLDDEHGTIATTIIPNTPADKAGLKVADVITKINNTPIRSSAQLRNTIALMRPGTPITLTVMRQNKTLNLKTTVGNPKKILQQQQLPFIAGLRLQDFSELEGDGSTLKGVVVADVAETSAAALTGLLPGDVITKANGQTITSVDQLKKMALTKPTQLLLQVTRGNNGLFLVIEDEASDNGESTSS